MPAPAQHRLPPTDSLAAKADLLTLLLENTPDRIYFKDLESRFIAVSQGLVHFLGAENAASLIGHTDFDFFGQEHAVAALEDEKNILRTGEPIINKIEKEDLPDGRVRWATTTKLPMLDDAGDIIGTFGVSRDFTGEKELEDRLAAERNLLRSVIDHIPDPIYVKDQRGAYVLDNASHRAFLGLQFEIDILGKTSHHFFPQAQADKFEKDDAATLANNQPLINRAEKATNPDGVESWLLTTKVPVSAPSQNEKLLVCIGRNVTEQKLAEERLLQANVELNAALDRLKKAHEDLRDVQFQLIEAERLKSVGRLAAGVAHEVKNPLAVLSLGVELLRQNIPASEEENCLVLGEMRDAIRRADTVVKGLLDFSVPAQMDRALTDFNELIRGSLRFLRGELKASAITVLTELAGDAPKVQVDAQKIEQVLVNLFMNAVQSMGKTGGTLTVSTRREQLTGVGSNVSSARLENFQIGDWLLIVDIRDTGPGIPADRLEHVFQPFYTTKATGSGTGLGLSVCKTIIDLHGGTIEIKNRLSGGAHVTLCLPEAPQNAHPSPP